MTKIHPLQDKSWKTVFPWIKNTYKCCRKLCKKKAAVEDDKESALLGAMSK